ncbi:MAG: YlqD family protein [Bacillota bacterium]
MESVTITRPVIVKVRVTESYRKAAAAEVREAVARIDMLLKQLELQAKKIAGAGNVSTREAEGSRAIEQERIKALESRLRLVGQLKEIGRLTDGQEVVHGRLESLVEIKVGDLWDRVMSVEVVLEDGRVVEIRQGGLPGDSDG